MYKAGDIMKEVTITVEDSLYTLFQKVGEAAGGIPPEQVMADALFQLAGALSLQAIQESQNQKNILN
jgi:hypothetical protein